MLPAIILFAATYVLMLTFSKYRPWFALVSGGLFVALGMLPAGEILPSLDFNVLLMIGGTMGLVQLFLLLQGCFQADMYVKGSRT